MIMHRIFPLIIGCCLSLVIAPLAAHGQGALLTIEQKPAEGFSVLGEWTLMKPENGRATSNNASFTYEDALPGNYLINVIPPSGMEARITQTINGTVTFIPKPQAPFVLHAGDTATISIQYLLVKFGKVSVTSDPPGLAFTLTGPNGAVYEGTTPVFYDPMPEGLYSITYKPIRRCSTPNPQSGRLVKDSRVVLSVVLSCDALDDLPQQQQENLTFKFVRATIGGLQITFSDVPLNQWYSEPIHRTLEAKVMSGYRNDEGNPTGMFGTNDPVTLAELAKIAHRLASIDEETGEPPENPAAQDAWFAPYIASAEQKDWLVFADHSVDPLRPATRAEVVATLLQALRVPRDWPTGVMFSDVSRTLPYAACVETAATKGLVGGYTDQNGKPTNAFGPTDPVNRAQMAKIIATAMDIFLENSPEFQPE